MAPEKNNQAYKSDVAGKKEKNNRNGSLHLPTSGEGSEVVPKLGHLLILHYDENSMSEEQGI